MPEPPREHERAEDRLRDPEAQLGGADAVEKTTYVVGKGTDPTAIRGNGPAAAVPSRTPVAVVAVVVLLMILVAVAWIAGLLGAR